MAPRRAIVLIFIAYGCLVGSHIGALPFLVERAGVSPLLFGITGSLASLANISAMGLGGWINRRFDHRTVLLASLPLCLVIVSLALALPQRAAFVGGFVLLFAALGATDLFMNAEASRVQAATPRQVFNMFHAAATLALAMAAIASSLISAWFGPVFAVAVAMVGAAAGFVGVVQGVPHSRDAATLAPVPPRLPLRLLVLIGTAVGFNIVCETAAVQWAGQLLVTIAPDLAFVSGLGVAFYGLCGGLMRLAADRLREQLGDVTLLASGAAVAMAGFLLLGTAPGYTLSVAAFAAVGIGLAATVPCLFSLTGRLVPDGRAAALGTVSAVGGVPRIILPWVFGLLAQQASLPAVFLACAATCGGTLALVLATYRRVGVQAHAAP